MVVGARRDDGKAWMGGQKNVNRILEENRNGSPGVAFFFFLEFLSTFLKQLIKIVIMDDVLL